MKKGFMGVGSRPAEELLIESQSILYNKAVWRDSQKTRPTVKVRQYKLRRGPVHQGVKDSRKDRLTNIVSNRVF